MVVRVQGARVEGGGLHGPCLRCAQDLGHVRVHLRRCQPGVSTLPRSGAPVHGVAVLDVHAQPQQHRLLAWQQRGGGAGVVVCDVRQQRVVVQRHVLGSV